MNDTKNVPGKSVMQAPMYADMSDIQTSSYSDVERTPDVQTSSYSDMAQMSNYSDMSHMQTSSYSDVERTPDVQTSSYSDMAQMSNYSGMSDIQTSSYSDVVQTPDIQTSSYSDMSEMYNYSDMSDIQTSSYSDMIDTSADFMQDRSSKVPSYSDNIRSSQNYDFGSTAQEPSFSDDVTISQMSESFENYDSMFSSGHKRTHNEAAVFTDYEYDYANAYEEQTATSSYNTPHNWSDYDLEASARPGPKKSKVSSTAYRGDYFNETVQMENSPLGQASSSQMHGGKGPMVEAPITQPSQQPEQQMNGGKGLMVEAPITQPSQQPEQQTNDGKGSRVKAPNTQPSQQHEKEESDVPSNWKEIEVLLAHLAKHKGLGKLLGDVSKKLLHAENADGCSKESSNSVSEQNYAHGQPEYDQRYSALRQRDIVRGQSGRGKPIGRGQPMPHYDHSETSDHITSDQYGHSHGQFGQGRGQFGRGHMTGQGHGQVGQGHGQFGRGHIAGQGRGLGRANSHQSSNYVGSGLPSSQRGTSLRGRGHGQQDSSMSNSIISANGRFSRGRGSVTRGGGQMTGSHQTSGRGGLQGYDHSGPMSSGHFKCQERSQPAKVKPSSGPENKTISEKLVYLRHRLKSDTVTDTNSITMFHKAVHAGEWKLNQVYNCNEAVQFQHKPLYSGSLLVCGAFIIRCMGRNKKALKHDVFTRAIERFNNMPISQILLLNDPGMKAVNERFTELDEKSNWTIDLNGVIDKLIALRTPSDVSIQHDLSVLLNYIMSVPRQPENVVCLIEQGFRVTHFKNSHKFIMTEGHSACSLRYKGALIVGNVILGEAESQSKKDCKLLVYNIAVNNLKTKSVAEIASGKTVEEFEINAVSNIKQTISASAFTVSQQTTFADKLDILCRALRRSSNVENNMANLDSIAFRVNLTPTIVYYKKEVGDNQVSLFCDLYINDLFVASSVDTTCKNRKTAHISAYVEAWRILTETSGSTLTKNGTLTDEIRNGQNVVECIVKGMGNKRSLHTNKQILKLMDVDPFHPAKKLSSLLILQRTAFADDLMTHAFDILLYSATMCEMLVDCDTTREDKTFFCTVTLQNQVLADSNGNSKATARNRAACKVISNLVWNGSTVVETTACDDPDMWTSWSEIYNRSQELRKLDGAKEIPITEYQDYCTLDASLITEPPDKYIMRVLKELIKTSLDKDPFQEVIVGPGMPGAEMTEITRLAKDMSLRVDMRGIGNKHYFSFYNKYQAEDVIPLLKRHNGLLGSFSLCTPAKAQAMWSMRTPTAIKWQDD